MLDKEIVMEILRQIEEAAAEIVFRFQTIHQVADFTERPAGIYSVKNNQASDLCI